MKDSAVPALADSVEIDTDTKQQSAGKTGGGTPPFETVFQILDDPVFHLDRDGRIVHCNPAAAECLGAQTPDELSGTDFFSLFPPEISEERKPHFTKVLETGETVRFQDSFADKTFHHTFTISNDNSIILVCRDITETVRTEEELRREQQERNFFLESLPGFVFLLNYDFSIRYANKRFRKFSGRRKDKKCYELLYDRTSPCPECPALAALSRERIMEWETIRKDGRMFRMYAHPMGDGRGDRFTFVLGMDITEQKHIETNLAGKTAVLEAAFDCMDQGIVMADDDWNVVAFNRRLKELLEMPEGYMEEGRNFEEVLEYWIDRNNGGPMELKTALHNASRTDSFRFEINDVSGKTIEVRHNPFPGGGLVRTFTDITERKQAENELAELNRRLERLVEERTKDLFAKTDALYKKAGELAQANAVLMRTAKLLERAQRKAEAATRAKSVFLANMSHEIRTPLNAIMGMTELALRQSTDEKQRRRLTLVKDGGSSLLSLLNDVLDFSKIEARKMVLEVIDFDLHRTIKKSMELMSVPARQKNLSISYEIDKETPRYVKGDPVRLRRVLANLINNAVKFTETGGIDVQVSRLQTHAETNGGHLLLFSVQDTGRGISDEHLSRIFESFSQADDSTSRRYGGSGLGLTICKELIGLMGGNISVISEAGKGSTFYFTVRLEDGNPKAVDTAATKDIPAEFAQPDAVLRILVAEDNEQNRELVSDFLGEQGHTVECVENGKLVLERLAQDEFDLVLMDGEMPIMDGITAVRKLRAGKFQARNPDIPVVALTAHAMEGDQKRYLRAGMNAYLSKPLDLSKLNAVVNTVASGGTLSEEQAADRADADIDFEELGDVAASKDIWDREGALKLLRNNEKLLKKVAAIFLKNTPQAIEVLYKAAKAGNAESLRENAHAVKGNASGIGAVRITRLAEKIEKKSSDGKLHLLLPDIDKMNEEFARLVPYLVEENTEPSE